jgi:putative acetyltransferase
MSSLRPATDADGPAIAALIARVFTEYEGCPFIPGDFPELGAPASHYAGRRGGLWVLGHETIAGSVGVSLSRDGRTAELHKLYLDRGLRGSGKGAALYDTALAFARASGARALRLFSDTRFLSGHRFYEKRGFRRLPCVRALGDGANSWEYVYRLPLVPS